MVPLQVFAFLAVMLTSGLADTRRNHYDLLKVWETLSDLTHCPGCGARRLTQGPEITALRIESIKQQILKKLRLKEPPTVSMPRSALPIPLANGTILQTRTIVETSRDVDDFYGTTDQVIIFPQEDGVRCTPVSVCFTFRLPAELETEDVTMAELWFFKETSIRDKHNQTFIVSEVPHWDSNQSIKKTEQLAIHHTDVKAGWTKTDLFWAVKNWLEYQELMHTLNIACETCVVDITNSPEHKPFIIINTKTVRKNRRPKRNINCHPGVSECCRENLYISFADIGWDDWILQPSGYHAYFCRGSCTSAAAITRSANHYTSLIQRMVYLHGSRARQLGLVPCCAPTLLSSLQLLYMDTNQTLTQKTLPNLVVESCGCM